MLTSCPGSAEYRGNQLFLCLGIAWKGSAFDPSWAIVSYLTYVSLHPVIEHICFGPRSQMRIQVKRTPASFFVVLIPWRIGDIHFRWPLGSIVGKRVFCLTVVGMCVLFNKTKILSIERKESGRPGSDCRPTHP